MRSIKITISAVLLTLLTAFVSCSKNESEPKPDNKTLITQKAWVITGYSVATDSGDVDVFNDYFDECQLDDSYLFRADNVFVIDLGTKKCFLDEAQQYEESWEFNEDQTKIFASDNGNDTVTLTIVELTESKLVLTFLEEFEEGEWFESTTTMVHP